MCRAAWQCLGRGGSERWGEHTGGTHLGSELCSVWEDVTVHTHTASFTKSTRATVAMRFRSSPHTRSTHTRDSELMPLANHANAQAFVTDRTMLLPVTVLTVMRRRRRSHAGAGPPLFVPAAYRCRAEPVLSRRRRRRPRWRADRPPPPPRLLVGPMFDLGRCVANLRSTCRRDL